MKSNTMTRPLFWHLGLGLMVLALSGFGGVTSAADHWLELEGDEITVAVGKDLALKVYRGHELAAEVAATVARLFSEGVLCPDAYT